MMTVSIAFLHTVAASELSAINSKIPTIPTSGFANSLSSILTKHLQELPSISDVLNKIPSNSPVASQSAPSTAAQPVVSSEAQLLYANGVDHLSIEFGEKRIKD
jgi:hypothetical protein